MSSALAVAEPGPEPSTSYAPAQQQQQQQQQQRPGWWPGQRRQPAQPQQQHSQQQSGGSAAPGGRRITIPRGEIPLDLLVARPDPSKLRPNVLVSERSVRRANRDAAWAMKREHVFAALAAGFHVALFAYNLAFWGFEGQAPDRYWPCNPRYRLQVRPGRYGNLEGSKSLYYYYLSRFEGGK